MEFFIIKDKSYKLFNYHSEKISLGNIYILKRKYREKNYNKTDYKFLSLF